MEKDIFEAFKKVAEFCREATPGDCVNVCPIASSCGQSIAIIPSHWNIKHPVTEREMTDAEIFKALREGAIIKHKTRGHIYNHWSSGCHENIEDWVICYKFSGDDSDLWVPLTIETVEV